MTKSLWRYLADLPPIDWAYLASERRRPGDKFKLTPEQIAKRQKARTENQEARRRVSIERSRRRQRGEWKGGRDTNITARILAAMEPGNWYGNSDIRKLSGIKRGSAYLRLRRLVEEGLVERAPNPDYEIRLTPQFLYRLTAAGELERKRIAYVI